VMIGAELDREKLVVKEKIYIIAGLRNFNH
jgi:hypothetical protein